MATAQKGRKTRSTSRRRTTSSNGHAPAETTSARFDDTTGVFTLLVDADLTGVGKATADRVLEDIGLGGETPATKEQIGRAEKPRRGLTGKALATWVVTGESIKDQAAKAQTSRVAVEKAKTGASRSRARTSGAKPEDVRAAEIAVETAAIKGQPLSQRVTPKEIVKTRKALVALAKQRLDAGAFPNAGKTTPETFAVEQTAAVLGFTSFRKFKAYVAGETKIDDDAKAGVRDLKTLIGSHQVWARKAAAAAIGIAEQVREEATSS